MTIDELCRKLRPHYVSVSWKEFADGVYEITAMVYINGVTSFAQTNVPIDLVADTPSSATLRPLRNIFDSIFDQMEQTADTRVLH